MMNIIDTLINILSAALLGLLMFIGQLVPALEVRTTPSATTEPTQTNATTSTQTFPAATTTPESKTKPVAIKPAATSTPVSKPVTQPAPTPTTPLKTQEQINLETRAALVNILCTTKYGGYLAPISASGVIIDSRGVILTNAHVGQFFLLRDHYTPGNIECVVRMGSPAEPYYYAELLYLPPAWVAANASQITSTQAEGTGEHDYAFVRITGPVGTRSMPASFPTLVMASSPPSLGDAELLAAYPAGYLGGENIVKNLYQSSAVTYTAQLMSFDNSKNIDLFSIGGTVVSQAGSSGGAVVSLHNGALKGIIAVETIAASTGNRDLRAITLDHINRSLNAAGQTGLVALLQGDIATKAAAFNATIAPGLTKQLEAVLNK